MPQDVLELSQLHREGNTSWFSIIIIIVEITGNKNKYCDHTKNETKIKILKIRDNTWHLKRNENRQGKVSLYTNLIGQPGFDQSLNLSNTKLGQTMTKLRTSAHRLPIETELF